MSLPMNKWTYFSFFLCVIGFTLFCFDLFELNQLLPWYYSKPAPGEKEVIQVHKMEKNCGLQHDCPENSFSMYLSTGKLQDRRPKLCILGNYVIHPVAMQGGRGLNAVILESKEFKVISVRNFDTYIHHRTREIAEWINSMSDTDILIIFTSDEASSRLSFATKALLNKYGSGKIQNLEFRSQWYMITQKGTEGFTAYEKITYSKKRSWAEMIEVRGCIPRIIPKMETTADEPLKENPRRTEYCEGKREEKYKGFCSESRFEIIMPALQTNKSLLSNPVYSLPIYLYAGYNLEVLIAALDSILHQPGIVAPMVTILYDKHIKDIPSLSTIFGMMHNKTHIPKTFEAKIKLARNINKAMHPKQKFLIVLDADVILSPDFLFFLTQTFLVMEKDETVSSISFWSANCYSHNGSVHLAYRVEGTPKYAALINSKPRDLYGEMISPDVSRVQGLESCHLPSLEPNYWIERPQDLAKERYFQKLVILQQLSKAIDVNELLSNCTYFKLKNEVNALYLSRGGKLKMKVLECLGIIRNQYAEYAGIIRLFAQGKTVLIITSESSFYKSRPITSYL